MIEADKGITTSSLLGPDEPPAVEIVNANGNSNVVLVCDHASNRVPQRLGNLGLDTTQLANHIGWDPGAADVARRLSVHLHASLVLSGYSRLVIDCNRPPISAESMTEQSAGVPIPGNTGLSAAERERRINELFLPYHGAIERLLDRRSGRKNILLSIHSFTPVLNGQARPWQIGVCYGHKREFAALLLGALNHSGNFMVGDNEPYAIEEAIDYTIPVHGEGRGLPSAMIEIRQDGLQTKTGVDAWAMRLAEAYRSIEKEALHLTG